MNFARFFLKLLVLLVLLLFAIPLLALWCVVVFLGATLGRLHDLSDDLESFTEDVIERLFAFLPRG